MRALISRARGRERPSEAQLAQRQGADALGRLRLRAERVKELPIAPPRELLVRVPLQPRPRPRLGPPRAAPESRCA
jgi:hypothetical protein